MCAVFTGYGGGYDGGFGQGRLLMVL